ncbi:hypothetical protein ACFFUB_12110 [Algimonas porphyrae]|uniref:Uncharacterized protein n=1 Tax=Algimonas porphyrae TaxID=1128113 RepID=A0ABQ5UVP4_9PROT|nr:hypothetical protein [Algimonas porphyrae]GLQ19152.1 hypothetical protein GCM10007854_01070 [Algimonas porphyrae]
MPDFRALLSGFILALIPALSIAQIAPQPAPMTPNEEGDFLPDPSQEVPLSEAQLLAAFSDKTHRGTYNFKRPEIDTFAFVETTTSDGRTRHVHGDKVDTGTWRVKANVICFSYINWDGGTHNACFNIFQRGNCYYHYGLNVNGLAGMGGSFTARSVHEGETPECEPSMV